MKNKTQLLYIFVLSICSANTQLTMCSKNVLLTFQLRYENIISECYLNIQNVNVSETFFLVMQTLSPVHTKPTPMN